MFENNTNVIMDLGTPYKDYILLEVNSCMIKNDVEVYKFTYIGEDKYRLTLNINNEPYCSSIMRTILDDNVISIPTLCKMKECFNYQNNKSKCRNGRIYSLADINKFHLILISYSSNVKYSTSNKIYTRKTKKKLFNNLIK